MYCGCATVEEIARKAEAVEEVAQALGHLRHNVTVWGSLDDDHRELALGGVRNAAQALVRGWWGLRLQPAPRAAFAAAAVRAVRSPVELPGLPVAESGVAAIERLANHALNTLGTAGWLGWMTVVGDDRITARTDPPVVEISTITAATVERAADAAGKCEWTQETLERLVAICRAEVAVALQTAREETPRARRQADAPAASGWLSARDLAEHLGVPSKLPAIEQRLRRWRDNHATGWMEIDPSERNPRDPKFLYEFAAVQAVIADLRA